MTLGAAASIPMLEIEAPQRGKNCSRFHWGGLEPPDSSEGMVTSGTWRVEDLPTNLPTLCHPSSPSLAFSSSGGSLVFYSQGRVSRVMLQTGRFPKIPSLFTPNSDPIILSSIPCHTVLPASQPTTTRHAYNRTRLSYSNYARS